MKGKSLQKVRFYLSYLEKCMLYFQRMLDLIQQLPPGEPCKVSWWSANTKNNKTDKIMELRVCKKYRKYVTHNKQTFL